MASAKAQADWEIANRNLFEEANAKYLAALSAYNAIVESRTAEHTAALDAYCSEMVAYEQSKALFAFRKREYDAALELALARDYLEQSRSKESRGLRTEAQRTLDIAHQRLREIVKNYSATPAADDAKAMLAGKLVEPRKIPALLVRPSEPKEPPALVLPNAPERFLVQELPPIAHQPGSHGYAYSRSTEYPTPVLIGGGRTVFVKGYFRKDGKYVHSHTRSAPGTKTRR